MATIDSLDIALIRLLEQNAYQSSEVLARQLHVSPSTVRRRIRKLLRSDIMQIVAMVDPHKVGFPLVSVIAFDVAPDKLASALQKLASYSEVKWTSATSGRFDVWCIAMFRSTDELSGFVQHKLANIEGLNDSETCICFQVEKGRYMRIFSK